MKKFWVVCYDIVDDKKRARIAKIMENYGKRVQKSVFECFLNDREFEEMKKKVEKEMDFEQDSINYYFLCEKCKNSIAKSGIGGITTLNDVEII